MKNFGLLFILINSVGFAQNSLLFFDDFNDSGSLINWKLEGNAAIQFRKSSDTSYIVLHTGGVKENPNTRFNFWCLKDFEGDYILEFRVKAQKGNKSILNFNVQPTSGLDFFDWERSDAQNETVGGSELVEMYILNILRDNGNICYFRHLGGNSAKVLHITKKTATEKGWSKELHLWEGNRNSIAEYENVFNLPEQWYDFKLVANGNIYTFYVNGQKLMEKEDTGKPRVINDEHGNYEWTPIPNGGYFGFRNFSFNKWVAIDYVKITSLN